MDLTLRPRSLNKCGFHLVLMSGDPGGPSLLSESSTQVQNADVRWRSPQLGVPDKDVESEHDMVYSERQMRLM